MASPDSVYLEPWIVAYEDHDHAAFVAQGHGTAAQAADELRPGVAWSRGFLAAVERFANDWVAPAPDAEDAKRYHDAMQCIRSLQAPATSPPADRDAQIDTACLAAQRLRLYWVDHAPKPATRRVQAMPGRNEPCHCGSGLKFKKCHGAAR